MDFSNTKIWTSELIGILKYQKVHIEFHFHIICSDSMCDVV